ncbi:MAG: hypothetical protein RLZZ230_91 [Candidatus Parcubacteria bacterium]|jgi:antitoxin component of RelBE/YafQ-DinJ toxin-antitoxin module
MKTVLNVKTDVDVKEQAQLLAKHLGVPLSIIVNSYLKEFIRSGEFTLSSEPKLKSEVARRISQAVNDIAVGKNASPTFTNVDDAMAWLNK